MQFAQQIKNEFSGLSELKLSVANYSSLQTMAPQVKEK